MKKEVSDKATSDAFLWLRQPNTAAGTVLDP